MGYQVNMNPLVQSGVNQANMLQGLGQTIGGTLGGINRRDEQQAKDQQMQQLMQAAASGDQQAIDTLYSIDPTMGKQFEDRMFAGQTRQTDQRAMDTADLIEKMAFSNKDMQARMFEAAVNDDRFDIDEDDRDLFMIPKYQQAAIAKAKGEDYAKRLFDTEKPSDFQQATGKEMAGHTFNPNNGEFTINPEMKARIDAIASKPELDSSDRMAINKEFSKLTKDTKLIRDTAADLDKLSKMVDKDGNISGPSSIAMVFKFMKALDPTSVVRESEFQVAEASSGVPENLSNMYNKLWNGGKLGPKQVAEFITTAKGLSNSSIDSSTAEIDGFLNTFEGTIPKSFSGLVRKRIPKRFEIKDPIAPVDNEVVADEFVGFKVVR